MSFKKNVLFVVKKEFINMEKEEENALAVDERLGFKMVSVSGVKKRLKNGY